MSSLSRYYHVTLACGVIAVRMFLAEWLYMGQPRREFSLGLVVGLLALTLIGGNAIRNLPLVRLNRTHYSPKAQPAERESSGKYFRILNTVSKMLNLHYHRRTQALRVAGQRTLGHITVRRVPHAY